jgi:hypothetical protein
MKKILSINFLLAYFVTINLCFGQKTSKIKVLDSDNTPLENILVINDKNKKYIYTDKNGLSSLPYENIFDTIIITNPIYYKKKVTIKDIRSNNNIIKISQKVEYLNEIIVKADKPIKFDYLFEYKKKNNFIKIMGSDASTISSYEHKKCKNCILKAFSFKFKISLNNDNDYYLIRPLVMIKTKDSFKPLLNSNKLIKINNKSDVVNIDISKFNIKLEKNKKYFFGFTLLNKLDLKKAIKISIIKPRKVYTYIKASPTKKWYKLQNKKGFSLDLKLYFEKID